MENIGAVDDLERVADIVVGDKNADAAILQMAHQIAADLRKSFPVDYDESGSIGKRYRRQDEVGTPFCITVDGESAAGQSVTVRDRDTLQQDRVSVDALRSYLADKLAR